ncbi:hypothetical protein LTR94_026229, partial [Friedmanniomyces endolithicus]
ILGNLLSNAVKFTAQGQVSVHVDLLDRGDGAVLLTLEVRDTGIGFGADHAAQLFQRFSQADATITRRFGGTGLGLSICRSLAELMGGTIQARSIPGKGSVFTVRLPLARAAPLSDYDAKRPGLSAPDLGQGRLLRVLLAEDHPINQRVVQLILSGPSIELTIVEDGAKAVRAFNEATYDLILMDMQMPNMDGISATREIRRLEASSPSVGKTPVLVLSANAMAEHRQLALAAGADLHIPKPITAASLLAGIQTVMSV